MDINIDRIIQSYLDALDSRPYNDAELCTELGEIYNASKRPHIGMAFLALVASRSQRAADATRQYNAMGNIDHPCLAAHEPVEMDAQMPGTLCCAANARFFPFLLNMIGSAQLNSWRSIRKIIVCDLGLFPSQAAFLAGL